MEGTPVSGPSISYNILDYLATPCFEPLPMVYGKRRLIWRTQKKSNGKNPNGTTEDTGPLGNEETYPADQSACPPGRIVLTTSRGSSFFAGTQTITCALSTYRNGWTFYGKVAWPVGSQSCSCHLYRRKTGRQLIVVQLPGSRHSPDRGETT